MLFLGEMVCLDSCKLCVIGNEMAGKTTFVNFLLNLNQPPIDPHDRINCRCRLHGRHTRGGERIDLGLWSSANVP